MGKSKDGSSNLFALSLSALTDDADWRFLKSPY